MVLCGVHEVSGPSSPGYTFNFRRQAWRANKPLILNREEPAIASSASKIYAIGGYTSEGITASVEAYDIAADSWSQIAPMVYARRNCAAVWIDSELYVFGGDIGEKVATSSVEIYSEITQRWRAGSDLPTPRFGHRGAALGSNIYVCGGKNTKALADVDIYNVDTHMWTRGPPMTAPRVHFGLAVIGERLYAVGGCNGESRLCSLECLEEKSETWRRCARPPRTSTYPSIAVCNFTLYAMGGGNFTLAKGGVLDTVDRYDPDKDKWSSAGCMPTPRWGHGSVVTSTCRTLAHG